MIVKTKLFKKYRDMTSLEYMPQPNLVFDPIQSDPKA